MPMRSLPLPAISDLMPRLSVKYRAIVAIGVGTGCRVTEIVKLRRFDLLTSAGELRQEVAFLKLKAEKKGKKKGKKEKNLLPVHHRKMSIPTTLQPYILEHLRHEELSGFERPDDYVFRGKLGSHLSRQRVYKVFRALLGEGYGTHWMRKTFAQELFRYFLRQNTADPMRALELTRQALDHARIDTTIKYLGITATAISDAQESIFAIINKGTIQ